MSNRQIAALIVLAALGGYVLGRLSTDLRFRIPSRPVRIDTRPFRLVRPGPRAEDSDTLPLGESPFLGPGAAKITLVEFCDFECPFCRRVASTIMALMERYPDDMRFVYRHLPLGMHRHADLAAQASLAAHAQGKFWEYHDRLFSSQDPLTRETLEAIAQDIELDMSAFRLALDEGTYRDQVRQDVALATRLGFSGTPSFVINGRAVVGAKPVEEFSAIIQEELEQVQALLDRGIPLTGIFRHRVETAFSDGPVEDSPHAAAPPSSRAGSNSASDLPASPPEDTRRTVQLEVFADYSDVEYRELGRTLHRLLEEFSDELVISFHSFLDPDDEMARTVSAALYFAELEGNLLEFHQLLVSQEGGVTLRDLEDFANQLDLNVQELHRRIEAPTNRDVATEMREAAERQGVVISPTVFVDGHRFVGLTPFEDLRTAIRSAMTE